eukprot:481672-Pyramimonas_sp.AAC.1
MREAREGGRYVHAQKAWLKILGIRAGAAPATARANLDNVVQELSSRYRASLDGRGVFHRRLELSVRGGNNDLHVGVLRGEGAQLSGLSSAL